MSRYLTKHSDRIEVAGLTKLFLKAIGTKNIALFKRIRSELLANHGPKDLSWLLRFSRIPRNKKGLSLYKKMLDELSEGEKIVGEITPSYALLKPKTIELLKGEFPNLKLIYIIRNPVDLDWSRYRMRFRNSYYKMNQDNYLELVRDLIKSDKLKSNYIQTIENYSKFYDSSDIKVLFFDELVEQPLLFLNKVLRHLDVKEIDQVPEVEELNKGQKMELPKEFELELYRSYSNLIDDLSEMFKSSDVNYPMRWKLKKR